MTESLISLTEGSGDKKIHTNQRTISGNAVEDQYTLPGEYPLPSYIALGGSVSAATADSHLLQLMAGSSLNVRVRRIRIEQSANTSAATATATIFQVWRIGTTAGTGGTTVTPRPFHPSDAASGATAMTLPTSKGTETVELLRWTMVSRKGLSDTSAQADDFYEWEQHPGTGPIVILAGTTNGIVIKTISGIAGASYHVTVEFTETSF